MPESAIDTTLRHSSSMCRGTVVLKDGLGHVQQKFGFDRRPFILLPRHRRRRRLVQDFLYVVLSRDSLTPRDDVQVRQPAIAHHSPHHDLQRLHDGFRERHL